MSNLYMFFYLFLILGNIFTLSYSKEEDTLDLRIQLHEQEDRICYPWVAGE